MITQIGATEEQSLLVGVLYETVFACVEHGGMEPAEALSCMVTAFMQVIATFNNPDNSIDVVRESFNSPDFASGVKYYHNVIFKKGKQK